MQIAEGIETGREYLWKETEPWDWFGGVQRWWQVFVEFHGFNGAGGCWVTEYWRWNGSWDTRRETTRSMSHEETVSMIVDIWECQREMAKNE